MKIRTILALTTILLGLAVGEAHAATWTYVATTADNITYYGLPPYRTSKTNARMWIKTWASPPSMYTVTLFEVNCKSNYVKAAPIYAYYSDGISIGTLAGYDWKPVVPDTIGERIADIACAV